MKNLEIPIPENLDLLLGTGSEAEAQNLARLLLAIKLFEVGRISSGQAAAIAGLSRRRFLLELPRYGVPSVVWDDEELETEKKHLR